MEQPIFTLEVQTEGNVIFADFTSNIGQSVAGLVGESRKDGTEYFIDASLSSEAEKSGNVVQLLGNLIIAFIEHFQNGKSFTIHIKMSSKLSDHKYEEVAQYLDKKMFIDGYRMSHERNATVRYLVLVCN